MKSQELSEFFSLIGQAKKEKEEEFDNLLKEANVDLDSMATSLFTGIENAKVEVKEQKKKEEKLIESLDSLLVSLDKPKETTPVVVGVPEDFDISSLEEEVEEEIVEEEVVEEETVEEDDTISKAIKFIDTQLKEELKDIEPNDPTVDSIKAEVKELRNILYKVLAHGPGSGETRLENLDDVDKDTVKVDGKFIKYDSSIGKFIGADASGEASKLVLDARNNNVGYAITIGTPVYQTGYNSGQDRINIEEARASDSTTMPAKGVTTTDLDNNTNGQILVYGELEGVDTSAFDVADELYVAPGGGLTNTRPTDPGHLVQKIAVVLKKSAANGAILVYGAGRTNDVPNTISIAGSITASTYYGDGSNLTGVGSTDNIITGTAATFTGNVNVSGATTFSNAVTIDSSNFLQLNDSTNIIGHNGVNNLFRFTDTVQFRGDTLFFQEYDGTEYLRMSEQFGVQIKHQGSTKLQIESDGITVTGTINDHTIPSGSGTFALTSDVPTNNNELTNGAGYITTSFTNTNQLTNGAGFITASDNITGTSAGLSGTPNITVGAITANSADFSGNVTIGGTLTYEDVTNIDSVGLITARNGVTINTGGLVVTSGISTVGFVTASNIYSTGIVTATSFVGDGSNLTGLPSSDLVNDTSPQLGGNLDLNSNNITGTGDIDFTGSLTVTSTDTGSSAAPELTLYRNSASPAPGDYLGQLMFKGENSNGGQENYAKITGKITDETLGTEDGLIETAIKGNGSFTIVSRQRSDELQLLNGVGISVDGDSTFTGDITANGNIVGDDSTNISGISSVTAANFFGTTQGQVSYITATETLTNKTLRNPTFESGANSPEFLETRYVNATQQDFVQLYTGGSTGSYFTQGEYQKVATITPDGNSQNYTFIIRLTATSASNYQIVTFTGGLRSNTLPDLDFTVNFSEEHNGVRFIEPKLWTKETSTAGFILAFEYVHNQNLYGGVNVEATIIPRSSAQRANVVFNTTQDSEQDNIDTGFTERDPTLTQSIVNGVAVFGERIRIEGATDNNFETTLEVVDPTADRTITFPDSTGTVALVGDNVTLSDGLIASGISTTTTTSQTSINSFSASTYRSAKYNIQITRGSEYQTTEISLVHDGSSSYGTEYATIKTGSSLASFDTDIDSGNVRLLATPTSSSSTVFKLVRTLIKV